MANSLTTNPIYIDTFSADVTISATPIKVTKVVFFSAAAGDTFCLEDSKGNYVEHLIQETNARRVVEDFGKGFWFMNGLYFDADDVNSGLGAGDKVWIYHANVE